MSETITACQNICNDFSWVGPFTEWIRNLAIVGGVVIGWQQLGSWRQEKIALKRAEIGEEIIVVTSELKRRFKGIRSPFGYGPPKDEKDDGSYDYRRRLRELDELSEEFTNLVKLKVRQRALIGSGNVDEAIESFFEARGKMIMGLNGMIRHISGRATRFGEDYSEKTANRVEKYDKIIWENYAENDDPINKLIEPAMSIIESEMIPLIRLEAKL